MNFKHRFKLALAKKRGKVVSVIVAKGKVVRPKAKKKVIKFDEEMSIEKYLERRKSYLEEFIEVESDEEKRIQIDEEYQLLEKVEEGMNRG